METSQQLQDPQWVMRNILAMQKQLKDDGEVSEEEFRDFKEKNPHLYVKAKQHLSRDDMRRITFMLSQLRDVRENTTPTHDASVNVGSMLVDDYVKPVLAASGAAHGRSDES